MSYVSLENTTTMQDIKENFTTYGIFYYGIKDANATNLPSYGFGLMLRVQRISHNNKIVVNSIYWDDDTTSLGYVYGEFSPDTLFYSLPYIAVHN